MLKYPIIVKQNFVAYHRLSTDRQGMNGNGFEAQQTAIAAHLRSMGGDGELLAEFSEIKSGKEKNCPALEKAVALYKKNKATLITASLDRLARNYTVLAEFMESGVDFIVCDIPDTEQLMAHIDMWAAQAGLEGAIGYMNNLRKPCQQARNTDAPHLTDHQK
ncbi:MAG: recombinase family protein [Magnetococcales bacterium]|nr:recombinase family protein [Magnetococcales bacterium]